MAQLYRHVKSACWTEPAKSPCSVVLLGFAGAAAGAASEDSQDNGTGGGGAHKTTRHGAQHHGTSPLPRNLSINRGYPSMQDQQQQQQQAPTQQQEQQHDGESPSGNAMEVVGHSPFMPPGCAPPHHMQQTNQHMFLAPGHH